jgi:hypothetical protein
MSSVQSFRQQALKVAQSPPFLGTAKVLDDPVESHKQNGPEVKQRAQEIRKNYNLNTPQKPFFSWLFFLKPSKPNYPSHLSPTQGEAFVLLSSSLYDRGLVELEKLAKQTPEVLPKLKEIASQYDLKADKKRFLSELTTELASPSSITQGTKGTCAATIVQYILLKERPMTYLDIIRQLSSKPHPNNLQREREWNSEGDGRSLPARLFQSMAMEKGNGDLLDYRNDLDLVFNTQRYQSSGLTGENIAFLLKSWGLNQQSTDVYYNVYQSSLGQDKIAILNQLTTSTRELGAFLAQDAWIDTGNRQAILESIKIDLKAQKNPIALILYTLELGEEPATHAIVVKSLDDKQVSFYNPQGRIESYPIADFKRRLINIVDR